MARQLYLLILFLFSSLWVRGQWPSVFLQPMTISGIPGLHSFAYGTDHGKWLLVGGRTDGLHRRQASSAFADADNNKNLYVVDPVANMVWSAPLVSLPAAIREQLSSTNMQFHQRDSILYCVGGYGYSATAANHITYPYLTAIDVPGVIHAIMSGTPINSYFRQVSNDWFAVTGGHLDMVYDLFYLVGGNKFTGRYNPMGGPSYTQEYTNQIRKMKINDDGVNIVVEPIDTITDVTNLHRRDYNLVPQIMPDGKEGLTAFSGVFKPTTDVPFLNCVNIDSNGYAVHPSFNQYYNHYHSANLPIYNSSTNEMHTLFLGGIAQYYDNAGTLVADNNVPFVKTIARVIREADGTMTEYKLPNDMPGFMGAAAEIILTETVPVFANHVIDYNSIAADTALVGYLVGGILSTSANIFTVNTGTESSALSTVYKVYLTRGATTHSDIENTQSKEDLALQVYPNPNNGEIFISFHLDKQQDILIKISKEDGRTLRTLQYAATTAGNHTKSVVLGTQNSTGTFFVTIVTKEKQATQKAILQE